MNMPLTNHRADVSRGGQTPTRVPVPSRNPILNHNPNQAELGGLGLRLGAGLPGREGARVAGFTLIEITIALAVVAFALVAIVGVLPIGLNVQRDNRAETIINHDGLYWMEAIRGGAQGLDELTNYVEFIVIEHGGRQTVIRNQYINPTPPTFQTGREIIGLLGARYSDPMNGQPITNAYAIVRSITGVATEKPGTTSTPTSPGLDFGFKYRLQVQLVSAFNDSTIEDFNSALGLPPANLAPEERLQTLYDVRLRFTWPILKSDLTTGRIDTGRRNKNLRSMVSRYAASSTNQAQNLVYTFLVP